MHIKKILHQNRRDFKAEYQCEHCGHIEIDWGYDDTNFHKNVIPNLVCKNCGRKADENYRALTTKYPDYMQI